MAVHEVTVGDGEASSEDLALLANVSAAVFQNPFSAGRHAIDLELADVTAESDRAALLARIVGRVEACLSRIVSDVRIDVTRWPEPMRAQIEHALLFVVFHRHADAFDEYIVSHGLPDRGPPSVDVGEAVLTELVGYGWKPDAAAHMVAVFFQMRRAFHFIDTELIGRSPCMRALRERLWNNVCTSDIGRYAALLTDRMEDFSTLLLGPTGSGKGAAAAAIGRSGFIPYDPRRRRFVDNFTNAFVPINLSSYPPTLIESELFGHRKGAFTGAIDTYDGVFSRCSRHGAVFLDEIGEVAVPVQIKLLRVLQERSFTPVGSHAALPFRGRVIGATHRDLGAMRRAGTFRDDFYYRLCSDVIEVPPLRLRLAEDPYELELLLSRLIERMLGQAAPELVADIATSIRAHVPVDYPWPGNVRELEQATRRILMGHPFLGEPMASGLDERARLVSGLDAGTLSAKELVSLYCRVLHARHGTYEEVARRADLDRRTVKKHILAEPGS